MFETFSAAAIQAISCAKEEALRLEFQQVNGDHLLLGLAQDREGSVSRALAQQGTPPRKLRLAIETLSGRGYSMSRPDDLVFGPAVVATFRAVAEGRPTLVEPVDLLRVLLQVDGGGLRPLFERLGLEPQRLLAEVERLAAAERDESRPAEDRPLLPPHFTPRLLTPLGARVLEEAYATTRRFGHSIVGTEDLLLGLLKVPEGLGGRVLAFHEVDRTAVEAVAAQVIGQGSGTHERPLVLSRWCKEALDQAWREAQRGGCGEVGTAHILLGLIQLDVGGALSITDRLALNLAQIRYDLEVALAATGGDPEPAHVDLAALVDGSTMPALPDEQP